MLVFVCVRLLNFPRICAYQMSAGKLKDEKKQPGNHKEDETVKNKIDEGFRKLANGDFDKPNDPAKPTPGQKLLIADLLKKPPSTARDRILKRARNGEFCDFGANSGAFPELELYTELMTAGFKDMAESTTRDRYADDA